MEQINRRRIISLFNLITGAVFLMLSLFPFCAYSLSIINDEETESYIQEILKPIYTTAGIPFNRNEIYIVNDPSLNAFVSDGNNMFIYTGTIINADDTNELSGVLAHETGHIMGGHILRQKLRWQDMQKFSLASLVLASAAGIASGRGDVAAAIMLGSGSSSISAMTAYQVQEERSADEAAVSILQKLGQSPSGMARFMNKIKIQNRLQGHIETPYFRTHPMTIERISFLENAAKKSKGKTSSNLDAKLQRIKAKLVGFLMKPAATRRIYPPEDSSINARYANTIADLQEFKYASAIQKIDNLLKEEPKNPHFMELKGQIYMEQGKVSHARKEFASALKIIPDSALFKYNLAQTILEDKHSKTDLTEVAKMLNSALKQLPSPYGWVLLSRTYDELGKIAERQYAAAKYSFETGEPETAKKQLEEAKKHNPNNALALKISDLESQIDNYMEENSLPSKNI